MLDTCLPLLVAFPRFYTSKRARSSPAHYPHTPQPTTMFEARLTEGGMLKKITEAMKDLVTEANFDCSTTGISLQAMVRCARPPARL